MIGNNYYTYDTIPNYTGDQETLGEKLLSPKDVPDEYIIDPASILKEKGWKYLKGAKDEPRKGTDDFTYQYKEGPMVFPDPLDKPSRTIITGEGGATLQIQTCCQIQTNKEDQSPDKSRNFPHF